jgi:hypothetical protein
MKAYSRPGAIREQFNKREKTRNAEGCAGARAPILIRRLYAHVTGPADVYSEPDITLPG